MKVSVINCKIKILNTNLVFLALYLLKIARFIPTHKINPQTQRLAKKISLLKILNQIKEKEVVGKVFLETNPRIQE
jgi:hypothetical protein